MMKEEAGCQGNSFKWFGGGVAVVIPVPTDRQTGTIKLVRICGLQQAAPAATDV